MIARPLLSLLAGISTVALVGCLAPGPTTTGSSSGPSIAVADPKAGWPTTFKVGLFGGDDAEAQLETYKPFKAYMEKKLGIPVELFTGTSYGAVIEAMRAKKVDAMTVGPFSYILAVQEANAEALAISVSTTAKEPVFDPTLRATYFSVISVKKGNGIATVNDLRGKNFAFVDPASTSGHLMPKSFLLKSGLNPDKDMRTIFAGSHPTAVAALWNDKVDGAASTETTLFSAASTNQIELCFFPDGKINVDRTAAEIKKVYDDCPAGKIAPLAYSEPIANTPFGIRQDMPESFKLAVRNALVDTQKDAEYIKVRKSWFVDPTAEMKLKRLDEAYNSLREIAKLLNLDIKQMS